ncbi:hypothetical protein AUP42_15120 [Thalassospira lucentensis]|uniref:Glycosyltransferase 2-like domain-containing protein n=1 Tax=Thalassospira lucentensis TaxID=168935 RepID=A0A154L921_9PROT|nr:hypothetical protein AUP42_15120 [Thalassospira lucentensis]
MIDRGSNSVSVIIPTWNRASSIRAAIESVLSQTFEVTEILVCDDGSTDSTAEIIHGISQTHPKVIWVSGPRSGRPAAPRNRGLKVANGQWIAFLDSDDIWLPNKLAMQLEATSKYNCSAVCTNSWRIKPNKSEKDLLLSQKSKLITFNDLLNINLVHCSSALVHRDILEKTGGFPESRSLTVGEDYALWLRVSKLTDIIYIGEPSVIYLDDPINSIRSKSLNGWQEKINVVDDLRLWILKEYKKRDQLLIFRLILLIFYFKMRKYISLTVNFILGKK